GVEGEATHARIEVGVPEAAVGPRHIAYKGADVAAAPSLRRVDPQDVGAGIGQELACHPAAIADLQDTKVFERSHVRPPPPRSSGRSPPGCSQGFHRGVAPYVHRRAAPVVAAPNRTAKTAAATPRTDAPRAPDAMPQDRIPDP